MSRKTWHLATAITFVLISIAQPAFAIKGSDPIPSNLGDIPRWPIYSALLVALLFACSRALQHFKNRNKQTRVFPKLALRRRLYAPYSGGNCAKIGFASQRDA